MSKTFDEESRTTKLRREVSEPPQPAATSVCETTCMFAESRTSTIDS